MGSLINAGAIIVGGLVGLFLKKGIKDNIQDAIFKILGIGIVVIGVNGLLTNMMKVQDSGLKSNGELLLIISLVVGTVMGELLGIDQKLNGMSAAIENRFHLSGFANSFVSATILFCVGAMAIIGSINEGLLGDPGVLIVKSFLDGITSIIFAATLGVGVIFACIPVLIYQLTITLLASSLQAVLTGDFLKEICMIGYSLVLCLGLNFILPSKIKVANSLPALLVPVAYHLIKGLF